LHNLGRYDESLNITNTSIKLFPDSTYLICNSGTEKYSLGDLKGALADLNEAI
jgi:hypothetical protein